MSKREKIKSRLDLLTSQRARFLDQRNHVLGFASLTDPKSSNLVLTTLNEHGPMSAEDIAQALEVPVFTIQPYLLGLRAKQQITATVDDDGESTWCVRDTSSDTPQSTERKNTILAELKSLRAKYPKELDALRAKFAEDDQQYHAERKRFIRELALVRSCSVCSEEFTAEGPSVLYCSNSCAEQSKELKQAG